MKTLKQERVGSNKGKYYSTDAAENEDNELKCVEREVCRFLEKGTNLNENTK